MGGLFGVVGRASQGAQLRAMGARLRHRGRGLSVACPAPEVALGSLHDAAGPGLASLERLAAVCDATIYDAPAPLTGSAESAGAGSGGSPAARLLALHEQEGLAAIERIDGDFASAIVDGQRREVVLARDFLGGRPLYWCRMAGGGVAFASEYKALVGLPGLAIAPDRDMVQFLQCTKQLPAGRTLISSIAECPPGTALRLDWSGNELARHAVPEIPVGPCITQEEEATDLVRARLTSAVERRSAGLGRMGLALSGGIDSIGVAYLLRRLHPGAEIHTYTAGYGPGDPELVTAAKVAAQIGARHHEVITIPDLIGQLAAKAVWHLEDPFARSDTVQLLRIGQEAQRDVEVLFTAQAADTLFAGMPKHLLVHMMPRLPAVSGWLKELYDLTQYSIEPSTLPGKILCRLQDRGKVPPVPLVIGASLPGRPQLPPLQRDEYLNRVLAGGLRNGVAQGVRKFERTFAASGLEHRSPFCDRRLVEAAFGVSDRLKIRGRTNKYVLRQALAGIVPDELLRVPKHPQRMRYDLAFADALDELARVALSPGRLRERGLFDVASVEALFNRLPGRAYAPEAGMRIWTAMLTEYWARLFLDQRGAEAEPPRVAA